MWAGQSGTVLCELVNQEQVGKGWSVSQGDGQSTVR